MIRLADLVAAIHSRLRLVLIVGSGVFLIIALLAFLQPRQYTADASLIVNPSQQDPDSGTAPGMPISGTVLGTQMDVLRSDAVVGDVARRLPVFLTKDYGSTPDQRAANASREIRAKLKVASDEKSNVISMTYTAAKPSEAAAILNELTKTYLKKQMTLNSGEAQQETSWYTRRTKEARDQLNLAQQRLSDFQRESGLIGIDRADVEAGRMSSLSTELAKAQADAAEANGRAGAVNDPSVAQSDIVQSLERGVGEQSSRVAELARELGPQHPAMLAAQSNLAALKQSLAQARAGQVSSLQSRSTSANRRVSQISGDLDLQRRRLLEQSDAQDKLSVLERDVDAAKETYDSARKRLNQAQLRSVASQTNASLLDAASPPILPSSPMLVLWLLAALILAAGTALFVACGLEFLRPRVRTVSGAEDALQIDVVSDISRVRLAA